MSQFDIVARLQLRAEQFSSETGQRFAELKTRARSAASEIRADFGGAFAEVSKLAQQSLQLPRTSGGALDLSSEIASLNQAALSSDRHAQALRELSIAQTAVAESGRGDAQALKLEADAAAVAALAAERDAQATRDRIIALEAVQTELNRSTSATNLHEAALRRSGVSAGQQRAAMQQLGFQVGDVATQFSSGTPPMQIFAQQSGQVIQALGMMTNKTTGLLGFLGGPWGAVLTAATIVAVPFIAKLWEGSDALAKESDKLRENAEKAVIAGQAKVAFAHTVEGVEQALRDNQKALADQAEGYRSVAEKAELAARAQIKVLEASRGATAARLEEQRENLRSLQANPNASPNSIRLQQGFINEAVDNLSRIDRNLAMTKEQVEQARRLEVIEVSRMSTTDRINAGYDDLIRKAGEKADKDDLSAVALRKQVDAINAQRAAALKAEQDREAAARRSTPLGTVLNAERGSAILASAQSYSGLRENTTGGKAGLRDLFSTAGISIDPEKVAWCAAFVNAVLAGQGIKGTGSLSARSFLNYGTATNNPTKGDIVVLGRGTGSQGHVGFYAGSDSSGRVLVTGGNQGNAVQTEAFSRSSVLAFRRAQTASAEYAASLKTQKDAIRDAEEAQRKLNASLDSIVGKYDPAAEAAARYRKELEQIADLGAAGKIDPLTQFSLAQKAYQAKNAADSQAYNDSFRTIFGTAEIDAALAYLDDGVKSVTTDWSNGLRDGARDAAEELRVAIGNIADIFGIRISGPLRALLQPGGIEGQAKETADALGAVLKTVGVDLSPKAAGLIKDALAGATYGQLGGSVFSAITGRKENGAASAIGGVLGEVAGKALGPAIGKAVGGTLGKTLGSAAGPIGAVVGGVLGNLVGGLFSKVKSGSATITSVNGSASLSGDAGQAGAGGQAASGVQSSLRQIIDALGGSAGSFAVSIGKRGDTYSIDRSGSGKTKGDGPGGDVASGLTVEEATLEALRDAIRDGAIQGISAASQKLLNTGSDIEGQLQKALLIEAIPRDLKAMLDPVGAAIDALNVKWRKTVDALKEGGATTDQMTQAERLYKLQLDQTKASTDSASATLKAFLTSLKIGNSSPLSLRDQEATALEQLNPYLQAIEAGSAVDQAKYQSAAQAYLDVERELYGSTAKFFEAFDKVQASTTKAIATIDNAVPITPGVADPFVQATAASAAATAANTATGNELLSQLSGTMLNMQQLLAQIAASGGSGGGFIGADRLFTQRAA